MNDKKIKTNKISVKSPIGARRMIVLLWCVTAIVGIVFMHVTKDKAMSYGALIAMMLIAALGGVDVWKQGILDKMDKVTP